MESSTAEFLIAVFAFARTPTCTPGFRFLRLHCSWSRVSRRTSGEAPKQATLFAFLFFTYFVEFEFELSQRSLHYAPIFRLLLKVAVKGTHQCDFINFCGAFGPQQSFAVFDMEMSTRTRTCIPTFTFSHFRSYTPRFRCNHTFSAFWL